MSYTNLIMFRKLLTFGFKDYQIDQSKGKRLFTSTIRLRNQDKDELIIYQKTSDQTLEELSENLETILEADTNAESDVRLESGVLTVVVDPKNIYVINKQTPNRQIWLSSPLSGPKRFDLISGRWVEKSSQVELRGLLSEEFSNLLKSKVEC